MCRCNDATGTNKNNSKMSTSSKLELKQVLTNIKTLNFDFVGNELISRENKDLKLSIKAHLRGLFAGQIHLQVISVSRSFVLFTWGAANQLENEILAGFYTSLVDEHYNSEYRLKDNMQKDFCNEIIYK